MIEVVAALLSAGDRILICRRPEGKAQGGLWEFPGGKIEPGETGAAALARECREELDVALDVGEPLADVVQDYPGKRIHLTLYAAHIAAGEPRGLEHSELRWVLARELGEFDWCPADAKLLEKLRGRI